jgi:LPXTG-motif cell wall-anchored protein
MLLRVSPRAPSSTEPEPDREDEVGMRAVPDNLTATAGRLGLRRALAMVAALTLAVAVPSVIGPSADAAIVATVPLGTAGQFSVLAATTVTNVGPTVLAGDLGVSPGTAVVGFPPGVVTPPATTHVADGPAAAAQADLTIAYNNAAGRPVDEVLAADLAGLTLQGGVYGTTANGALELNGTLTLDGAGNPNSVFIFQTGSTLITGTGSTVALINGAQECNVFWQVGSSATVGVGTTFVGNILALTSITVQSGATVAGRALARNGAVTLDTNVFTLPTCDLTVPTTAGPTTTVAPSTTGGGPTTVAPSTTVGGPTTVAPSTTAGGPTTVAPSSTVAATTTTRAPSTTQPGTGPTGPTLPPQTSVPPGGAGAAPPSNTLPPLTTVPPEGFLSTVPVTSAPQGGFVGRASTATPRASTGGTQARTATSAPRSTRTGELPATGAEHLAETLALAALGLGGGAALLRARRRTG